MNRPVRVRSVIEPVLGTQLDLQADVETSWATAVFGSFRRSSPDRVRHDLAAVVTAEVDRLARVFSVYDPQSELRRWREKALPGHRQRVSPTLRDLLAQSAEWQQISMSAYNPAVGAVFDAWRLASETGVVPSVNETDRWAAALTGVPYELDGDQVVCVADCTGLTFNSFAKGLIADRVLAVLRDHHSELVDSVRGGSVNLGGDIAIRSFPVRVGIENPRRPYDNEPPLCVLQVADGGVATSGASRRPIIIGAHTFSHLIDPRTCRPVVSGPASVTVVAESAAKADVLATVIAVTGEIPADVAAALVSGDGELTMSPTMSRLVV